MAKRTEYQIVGRYMDGKEVTAYHLQSIDTGKSGRYTRDQVAFLVGRDQITNCTAQIYQDKLILRGNGMSLDDLPVQYEDGGTRNTEQLGKIRKGTTMPQAMEQFLIVGTIKSGRNTVGYVIQNAGCGIKKVKRQQVIELAQQGKLGNARVQMYNGKPLLRGINCNLDELPCETISEQSAETIPQTTQAPQAPQSSQAPQAGKPSQTEQKTIAKPTGHACGVVAHTFKSITREDYDKMGPRAAGAVKTLSKVIDGTPLQEWRNFLECIEESNSIEGRVYRVGYLFPKAPNAAIFVDIHHTKLVLCWQDYDNDIEFEEEYSMQSRDAAKQAFIDIRKQLIDLTVDSTYR